LTLDQKCKTVEDLICQIEDIFGRENLYKLIFAGKLLKEEHLLRDYKLNSKVPIIVMVTKSSNNTEKTSQETEVATDPVCVEEASFKRVRTVTEDSGIEEDINNEHFVTAVEFDSVIEVIVTCQYLTSNTQDGDLTQEETRTIIDKYCAEVDDDFRDILNENIDKIMESKLNKSQLFALLEDVRDIYDEPRCRHVRNEDSNDKDLDDLSDFDDEEDEEEQLRNKIERLTEMGFGRVEAEAALNSANNNLTVAAELLMPSSPSISSTTASSKNNPLAFLRDIEEFQFLRYQVLHDPNLLQPLLISFGQSHPQIMKSINENKDIFISMLYEQTGAKLTGRH